MEIITTHRNTDFDAFASTIAATLVYPEAVVVLPHILNPNVRAFLSIHKDIFATQSPKEIDLDGLRRLVLVDVNRWDRLDRIDRLQNRAGLEIHLWDHHMDPGDVAATWRCQENVGATVTLLVRRLREDRKVLTPIQATLFLAGLYEDTGNLTFPSSTAEDAYAAAYLLERGADLNILSSFLRPAYGQKQKDTLFLMLQTADRVQINGFSLSINCQQVSGHVGNLAVVVEMYREILNADAAFGIFHDPQRDLCMVIGRSSTEVFDVGSILRTMGGGGHPAAGSALLKSVKPAAVQEWILELVSGNQQSSVQIGDLMSFPVTSVSSGTPMSQVAALLREKGCTGLPVVDDDRLVGMISRRDFRKLKKESQLKAPVRAFMKRDVHTIDPGRSPMQAARLMIKHDIGRLPVIREDRIIGIVTRSDVMIYFYDLLPD
ncbi:MAG: tRNA nucleotidyl transferase [Deltaproteobacteria bacterium SG8_13]|nr:MAG: tRNA nucleotidyl transferase [Deltaproteobacteria bacterium SG8_13]